MKRTQTLDLLGCKDALRIVVTRLLKVCGIGIA
jgi:hypothetical protein